MTRYVSNLDHLYDSTGQYRSNILSGSGWQSSASGGVQPNLSSASLTRLVVDSPFGRKKCDYTIDKSQLGRLIITARRRASFASDYLSLKNKNQFATQIFTIPSDADVNRLRSYIEPLTYRLIIEIPRTLSTYQKRYVPNENPIRSSTMDYRIDCHGYSPDDLDVYLQGRELMVEGRTSRGSASKRFSRKLTLPTTVDLSRVSSYFENGELRVQAPLRLRSPPPSNSRQYYRHHSRHRTTTPMRRVRSMESVSYPMRDVYNDDGDDDDDVGEIREYHQPLMTYRKYSENDDDRSFQF